MWKRDDNVRPAPPPSPASGTPSSQPVISDVPVAASPRPSPPVEKNIVNIGKSVVIKGELSGSEDLIIEGQVEGKIELRENVLTIGPNGKIKAQIFAKAVIVQGEVTGNITATEKVDIRDNGSVDGDIASPRVAIAEGAHFRGSIDMQRVGPKAAESKGADVRPEPKVESKPVAAAAAPVKA
jgi:cytoskeletal protein CcmA (bactofilin family)